MSFQTRLFLTYFFLIVMLVAILGVSFYQYTSGVFEKNAYSNLSVITGKMSQQLDKLIQPMDLITTYLLSTEGFMSSMTSLATIDRSIPENRLYITEGRVTIYSNVLNYTTDKNFYRVSFFNNIGDFLTSGFRTQNVNAGVSDVIAALEWTSKADMAKGKVVVIPPYADPWAISEKARVFGLARNIQGPKGGMGYIEVQQRYSKLEEIFTIPNEENIKVLAVTKAGELFFSNGKIDDVLLSYCSRFASGEKKAVSVERNPLTGTDEIVAGASSDYTGITVVLVQDRDALLKPLLYTANITLIAGILILLVSLGYIYIFSRQLSKPVRQLKEKMEGTELENLPEKITFESSNNEFKALNKSFQRLRERLNEAVSREIKSHALQVQANFDSLQAQVNPHFIFNILNVLSNRGMINGDEEISEICDSIASMLRYSTSTLSRTATIGEELEHVRNYLLLMKKRYEHKLEFRIEVDPEIYPETIPKIVLQQIVENCINHGFESVQTIMEISVTGYISNGWWYIEIKDNGQGFANEILNNLQDRMQSIRRELSGAEPHTGFAIGGMGLLNTYARMLLFYNRKFEFRLDNAENGGAKVTIGGIIGEKENEQP